MTKSAPVFIAAAFLAIIAPCYAENDIVIGKSLPCALELPDGWTSADETMLEGNDVIRAYFGTEKDAAFTVVGYDKSLADDAKGLAAFFLKDQMDKSVSQGAADLCGIPAYEVVYDDQAARVRSICAVDSEKSYVVSCYCWQKDWDRMLPEFGRAMAGLKISKDTLEVPRVSSAHFAFSANVPDSWKTAAVEVSEVSTSIRFFPAMGGSAGVNAFHEHPYQNAKRLAASIMKRVENPNVVSEGEVKAGSCEAYEVVLKNDDIMSRSVFVAGSRANFIIWMECPEKSFQGLSGEFAKLAGSFTLKDMAGTLAVEPGCFAVDVRQGWEAGATVIGGRRRVDRLIFEGTASLLIWTAREGLQKTASVVEKEYRKAVFTGDKKISEGDVEFAGVPAYEVFSTRLDETAGENPQWLKLRSVFFTAGDMSYCIQWAVPEASWDALKVEFEAATKSFKLVVPGNKVPVADTAWKYAMNLAPYWKADKPSGKWERGRFAMDGGRAVMSVFVFSEKQQGGPKELAQFLRETLKLDAESEKECELAGTAAMEMLCVTGDEKSRLLVAVKGGFNYWIQLSCRDGEFEHYSGLFEDAIATLKIGE
jgi:hypothetical protein